MEGRSVDDGRVCVLENFPFLFGAFYLLFVLERLCGLAEVDGIARIFLSFKDICNTSLYPSSRNQRLVGKLLTDLGEMLGRSWNVLLCELIAPFIEIKRGFGERPNKNELGDILGLVRTNDPTI